MRAEEVIVLFSTMISPNFTPLLFLLVEGINFIGGKGRQFTQF
jgi:hypothetical protein